MEVFGIFVAAALIGGAVWWFFIRKDDEEQPQPSPAPQPVPDPEPNPVPGDRPVLEDPAVSFEVNDLEKLTKAEIEGLGQKHGISISRGKSKMKMIDELRVHVLK